MKYYVDFVTNSKSDCKQAVYFTIHRHLPAEDDYFNFFKDDILTMDSEKGRITHSMLPKDSEAYLTYFSTKKFEGRHVGIFHDGIVGHYTEGMLHFKAPELILPVDYPSRYYFPVQIRQY